MIGRHKNKVYRMGESIKIEVASVNVFDGEIDFKLAKGD